MKMPVHISRAERLKDATSTTHERLDKAIMGHEPFSTRERYASFVKVQHAFHRSIEALYRHRAIRDLLPGIAGRSRLARIEQDLSDLGHEPPDHAAVPAFETSTEHHLPAALGWLYVAEGSHLGAAFLLKEAEKLGLSAAFGARHLAPSPAGRAVQWRIFKSELDAVKLPARHEADVVSGASAAFDFVRKRLDETYRP